MKLVRVKHDLRFVFITLSGFLIVGATATWHAMGYLSYTAWFFEWSDIVFAFVCAYLATREKDVKGNLLTFSFIGISAALVLIPLERTSALPVFTTPNPLLYLVFSIPIIFLAYFLIFRDRLVKNQKSLSFIFLLFILGTVMFVTYLFYSSSMKFPTDESVVDLFSAHLFLPDFLFAFERGFNLVIGTRYVNYSFIGKRSVVRGLISRTADLILKLTVPECRSISDPVSGFIGFKRKLNIPVTPEMKGNKLLPFLLVSNWNLKIAYAPYRFHERVSGKSKIVSGGTSFIWKFLREVLDIRAVSKKKYNR